MLIIGLAGKTLEERDRVRLAAPQVSGVILFTRNFASREQVVGLIESIRAVRDDPFLITVDQEGGPVQRFREGFTRLPALARIGEAYAADADTGIARAEEHAWLMASEMRAIGVDLSFAPVSDLARGNRAIGERAFSADPIVVSELVQAYVRGLHLAGMAATVKHFPGHGSVLEDTHFDAAIDPRGFDEMADSDLLPFADAIECGVDAIMLAHVTYPAIDAVAAGYSQVWIKDILRGEFGFDGVVIGDDIGMAAAESFGSIADRIGAHLSAGCDLVLACSASIVDEAIDASSAFAPCDPALVARLQGNVSATWASLAANPQHAEFAARLEALDQPEVPR